jgi:hypothetical protein
LSSRHPPPWALGGAAERRDHSRDGVAAQVEEVVVEPGSSRRVPPRSPRAGRDRWGRAWVTRPRSLQHRFDLAVHRSGRSRRQQRRLAPWRWGARA